MLLLILPFWRVVKAKLPTALEAMPVDTPCLVVCIAVIKTGESGLTVFRLLTKDNRWKWVQANARLVYKNGKPDYIIATQRPLG